MTLAFNWASVLSVVTFWVYGYYGAISSRKYPLVSLGFTIVSSIMFVYFVVLARKAAYFRDEISLRWRDGCAFLVYLAVLLGLSLTYLVNDLTLDQLYHAQAAHLQAMSLVERLAEGIPPVGQMVFAQLLWPVNVVILVGFAGVVYLLKRSTMYSIAVLTVLFLVARVYAYYTFEGTDPHPQLRLFPLWLTSSLFGINNIAFRLASLIALAALMWIVWRSASGKMSAVNAALSGLAAGTIPVVFHAGTIVEPSIWSSLLFSGLVLSLHEYSRSSGVDWARWLSLVAVVSLVRQTAVAAVIVLLVLFVDNVVLTKRLRVRGIAVLLSALLVMILIFVKSLYWGTPGSSVGRDITESALQRVLISLTSGTSMDIVLNSFHWSLFGFFVLAFIPFRKEAIKGSLVLLVLFAVLYGLFYAAAPSAWGTGRYQAEYVAPFIILGVLKFALLASRVRRGGYLVGLVLVLVSMNNVYTFKSLPPLFWNLPKYTRPVTITYPSPRRIEAVVSTEVNNYREMLKTLKKDGFGRRAMLVDPWVYGAFPQLLSGYSVNEVKFARAKFREYCVGARCSSVAIICDREIDAVMVDKRNGEALDEFEKANWRLAPYEATSGGFSNYVVLVR